MEEMYFNESEELGVISRKLTYLDSEIEHFKMKLRYIEMNKGMSDDIDSKFSNIKDVPTYTENSIKEIISNLKVRKESVKKRYYFLTRELKTNVYPDLDSAFTT